MTNNSGWTDYFTPIHFQFSKDVRIRDKSRDGLDEDEILARAQWAWNIGQNQKRYKSEYGLTYEVSVSSLINRHFIVHEPDQIRQTSDKVPLLIIFHGLNSSAWFMALVRTKWIEKASRNKFFIVFGQSQGKQYRKGPKYNRHGILQFGDDLSWEIQEPKDDFIYFDFILHYMKEHYEDQLNLSRIYYVGYSNGGLFSSNIAIHYGGHVLTAICNHCGGYGGLGYKDEELLNPNMIKKPLPIYILTGTMDNYLPSCEKARKYFENVGCDNLCSSENVLTNETRLPDMDLAVSLCRNTIGIISGCLFIIGSIAFWPSFGHGGALVGNWLYRCGASLGVINSLWYLIREQMKSFKYTLSKLMIVLSLFGSVGFLIGGGYFLYGGKYDSEGSFAWLAGSISFLFSSLIIYKI
ncbi:hypothetical protein I4U23_000896 [Adineta vaga]|nr:hypothetical protein I4U23_000896 [Adineta vaga]